MPPLTRIPLPTVTATRGWARTRHSRTTGLADGGSSNEVAVNAAAATAVIAAMAQNAACHPAYWPSTVPAGTPTMHASVTPDSNTEVARPTASAGTSDGSDASATARNPALANAASARVASRSGKSVVRAPMTCTPLKRPRKARSASLRGSLLPSIASTGAPTTIPAAKRDVSSPAVPRETPVPAAIWGSSPERTNSDVPCAKTAAARRKRTGGKRNRLRMTGASVRRGGADSSGAEWGALGLCAAAAGWVEPARVGCASP